MKIPDSYVLGKFYAYSGDPEFRKYDSTYTAGCPVCREGKSWGKKKRLFYYPNTSSFFCFNCSKSWTSLNWIREVCNLTREEIESEILQNKSSFDIGGKIDFKKNVKRSLPDLPYDSINLCDQVQRKFYETNKIFKTALDYAENRRLFSAVNKPSNLYISLTDIYHKNRLCIPFQNRNKKTVFYQTRALDDSNPRYLGKIGYDKTLFGIDRIDDNFDYIFIFEGPIDAMFVKNGVGAAGLKMTSTQMSQLQEFPFHKKIWVLDNSKFDKTAKEKTMELVNNSQKVFRWPAEMDYKDFNDMAVKENLDEIDYKIILNNLF